jgi:hypothetical protein
MYPFPPPPDVPPEQRASATIPLRYEDVTQDGRLLMATLSPALGEVVWRRLLLGKPTSVALGQRGIIPILSRLVMEGCGGPFATETDLAASGRYQLAHAVGPTGEVERLLVNMWLEASLPIGRNYPPKPEGAGTVIPAGRMFGEHVLTRLFAAPEDRRVRALDVPGLPAIPGARVDAVAPASVMKLPDGATPLEDAPRADPLVHVFGMAHTDSNQHVNSLVYPRLFEEAALRRLASLGRATGGLLARYTEASYRKPLFAGDKAGIVLQAFALGDRVGAVGAFVTEGELAGDFSRARPHCYVRMLLEG